MYQDDGETFGYRDGTFLRVTYACSAEAAVASVSAQVAHDGFTPWWSATRVTMFGVMQRPSAVRMGGKAATGWTYDASMDTLTLDVRDAVRDWNVEVQR